MTKKILIIFLIIKILLFANAYSKDEVFIKFRVDNEIITNIDIINEKNYLIALNTSLKDVSEKRLIKLSENSLIKEKIKKKEIIKYFDLNNKNLVDDKIISNLYEKMGIKSEKQFKNYLDEFDLNLDEVKNKIHIEFLWNRLIFQKYRNQIKINEKKLKKNLLIKIKNNKEMIEYNLSEIIFELQANENSETKFKIIEDSILKYGFKKTSSLISISDTSSFGGEVGWINKTQLTDKIIKNLNTIDVGKYTKPIQIGNAFMILKINDIRKSIKDINFDKEYEKLLTIEKNRQLNNFSIIHFNKIKKNISISET